MQIFSYAISILEFDIWTYIRLLSIKLFFSLIIILVSIWVLLNLVWIQLTQQVVKMLASFSYVVWFNSHNSWTEACQTQ